MSEIAHALEISEDIHGLLTRGSGPEDAARLSDLLENLRALLSDRSQIPPDVLARISEKLSVSANPRLPLHAWDRESLAKALAERILLSSNRYLSADVDFERVVYRLSTKLTDVHPPTMPALDLVSMMAGGSSATRVAGWFGLSWSGAAGLISATASAMSGTIDVATVFAFLASLPGNPFYWMTPTEGRVLWAMHLHSETLHSFADLVRAVHEEDSHGARPPLPEVEIEAAVDKLVNLGVVTVAARGGYRVQDKIRIVWP
jgi:hypothetical protein